MCLPPSKLPHKASGHATDTSVRIPVSAMQVSVLTEATPVSVVTSVGTGIHKEVGICGCFQDTGIGRYSQIPMQVSAVNPQT